MTREEARTKLTVMVAAGSPPVLSTDDLDYLLDESLVVDEDGLAPADTGYVETFDLAWAAAEAYELKAARVAGAVDFTSEGATFKPSVTAAQLMSMATRWRSRSSLGGVQVWEFDDATPYEMQPRSSVLQDRETTT